MTRSLLRKLFFTTVLTLLAGCALGVELRGTIWEREAAPGVDPQLLYAVALVETRKQRADGLAAPRPYILRVGSRVFEFSNYEMAARQLDRVMARDTPLHTIDIGMMQINPKWHGHRVRDLADFLKPREAVRIASEILREAMASTEDPVIGIGRYHSYTPAKARRYGRDVVHIACNIGWKNDQCASILAYNQ